MRNWIVFMLLVLFVGVLAFAGCDSPVEDVIDEEEIDDPGDEVAIEPGAEYYVFGSCGPGGVWNTLVGGVTTLLTNEMDGIVFTADVTGCSGENARRLETQEQDVALLHATHAFQALNNEEEFADEDPYENLRALAEVYFSPQTIVTLQGTGIETMQDLEGKRVVSGPAGSGTAYNTELWLDILGVEPAEILQIGWAEASEMMRDGQVDAFAQAGAPATAIVELAAVEDIHIIPFSDDEIAMIQQDFPYYIEHDLPGGTYEGQPEPVQTPGFSVQLFAHQNMPDDLIYEIMEIIFSEEGQDHLVAVHPEWAKLNSGLDTIEWLGFELHPGAAQFYEDNPELK